MPGVVESPVVLRDVFPARVTLGDHTYTTARAVITRDRLMVWITRAAPVLDAPYSPAESTVPGYHAPPRQPAHLTLGDGRQVTVARQRGCGCSSPLRSWRPWSPYRVARS